MEEPSARLRVRRVSNRAAGDSSFVTGIELFVDGGAAQI